MNSHLLFILVFTFTVFEVATVQLRQCMCHCAFATTAEQHPDSKSPVSDFRSSKGIGAEPINLRRQLKQNDSETSGAAVQVFLCP